MRRALALLITTVVSLVPATPAFAGHGGAHPTFRPESVYFHCSGSTKVQNLNDQMAAGGATWDTTAPSQSYTQGAGCGSADTFFTFEAGPSVYDAVFHGTFRGNLRDLTLRLHNLVLGRARIGAVTELTVRVEIDGAQYLFGTPYGAPVAVTPVPSSTGLTELVELSVTGLGSATEVTDDQGTVIDVETTGLATEDGEGAAEHEIVVIVTPQYTPYSNAWVWDATEIASGITFNPATLAAAKIAAELPEG